MVQQGIGIKTSDIYEFSKQVCKGQAFEVISRKAQKKEVKDVFSEATKGYRMTLKIKETYKHFAVMENGECFTWAELYIWNMTGRKAGEKL